MKIKKFIIDINKIGVLIHCETEEEFKEVIDVGESENMLSFSIYSRNNWSKYGADTYISVFNNTYGPLNSYNSKYKNSEEGFKIYKPREVIADLKYNPEYFL